MKRPCVLSLILLALVLACAPISSQPALPTPTLWVPPAITPAVAQGTVPATEPGAVTSPIPAVERTPTVPSTDIPPLPGVVLSPLVSMQAEAQRILSLAWAPDNSRFLVGTGGVQAKALVGNPLTGKWMLEIPTHAANIRQVTWSPDGASLAIAEGEGGQMFSLLDSSTGVSQIAFEVSAAICLSWSPDGQILAIGTDYGDLALWKPATDEIVSTLDGGTNDIDNAAWSSDGKKIATAVAGNVILWSWDGSEAKRLLTIQDAGEQVAWSPDGSMLATGGRHAGIWNGETGDRLLDLGDSVLPAWSQDSAMIVTASDKDMLALDARTGSLLFTATGHARSINTVAWSPDGTLVVSGDQEGVVIVWGVKTIE